MRARTPEAYQLFHDGTLAFSEMENNGIRIDLDYLDKTITDTESQIDTLSKGLTKHKTHRLWAKRFGDKTNVDSTRQLAEVLFKVIGHEPAEYTERSADLETDEKVAKTDQYSLRHIDDPFIDDYFQIKKLKKVLGTYLKGIRREVCGDLLHTSFNLAGGQTDDQKGGAASYRSSCIAKGTLIEIVRDVSKYPKGVKIEEVKAGDYVYCYNKDLKLTIRKVLWAGKTGHKKVMRIYWRARGKKGHLDLTPEHLVRLVSGEYIEARKLKGDFRKKEGRNKKDGKIRTLAMGRTGDLIYQTGNKDPIHDHRLVYRKLVGKLKKSQVVHHRDENHFNNTPSNLEAMTKAEHAKHHAPTSLTEEGRQKAYRNRRKRIRSGEITFPTGEDHHRYIKMTKFQVLRLIAEASGRPTKVPYDFQTFKDKAAAVGVDLKIVERRYGGDGRYITIGRLKRACRKGVYCCIRRLKINYYKAHELAKERGFRIRTRKEHNNHQIVKIEYLNKKVDVYDLQVEGVHNFIANEICVHNSSAPNLHNIPIRNKEMGDLIRPCFIPRKGRRLVERDFSGIEVRVSACYNKDPNLIRYIEDKTTDMHRDEASVLFIVPQKELEAHKDHYKKSLRDAAKNMWVFPQFYGSVWFQCAPPIWEAMEQRKFTLHDGTPLRKHLRRHGVTELGNCDIKKGDPEPGTFAHHLVQAEKKLWNKRFPVYTQWKKDFYNQYLERGYFDLRTGFRCTGHFRRNQVINFPVQGAAFHCLLWTLIEIQKELRKRKMRSMLVSQIHDSMIADVVEDELQEFLDLTQEIAERRLAKAWKWINIPIETEVDVTPIDGSWVTKAEYVRNAKGTWVLKV